MKLKLDENLGKSVLTRLREAGLDVMSVVEQELTSAPDSQLYEVCAQEQRCLVSLDLDFANPLRFPPKATAGIVVLRLRQGDSSADLTELLDRLAAKLAADDPKGKLWIVQRNRIREYRPD